jgi:hypothetical protein
VKFGYILPEVTCGFVQNNTTKLKTSQTNLF